MAKRKAPKVVETVELLGVLPIPAEVLTRKVALEWLGDWAREWADLVSVGLEFDDREVRSAHAALGYDLGLMLEAAAAVVATGAPRRITFDWGKTGRKEVSHDLATICASNLGEDGPHAAGGAGYAALAHRLVKLLAEQNAKQEAA